MYWYIADSSRPFLLSYLVLLGAVAYSWRGRGLSRRRLFVCASALGLFTIGCTPLVAWLALGSLEWRYPPGPMIAESADPIVVLAGSLRAADDGSQHAQLAEDSLVRCVHGAMLYHQGAPRLIVVSGGKVNGTWPPLAHVMRDFLLTMGIPETDILVEDQAHTTYENAVQTAKLLRARDIRRIVLVTETTHLLRAELCFRKAGFEVTPVGCNYRATEIDWSVFDVLPSPEAALNIDRAFHEWLGLIWYRLHGRV